MKYQYRWYYAAVVSVAVMILVYVYDLKPAISRLTSMRQSEARTSKKLKIYRKKIVKQPVNETKNLVHSIESSTYLSDILALVSVSGMVMQTVNLSKRPSQDDDIELIHLVALGQFHQATAFFYAIARQTYPVLITNFSYKKNDKNIFSMTMDVLVWKENASFFLIENDKIKVLPGPHNPFCGAENAVIDHENDVSALQSFALARLKMQGYLQQGERHLALILLPNNSLVAVQNGAVIGKEHAIITEIFRDHTQFLLPGKQKKTLTLTI